MPDIYRFGLYSHFQHQYLFVTQTTISYLFTRIKSFLQIPLRDIVIHGHNVGLVGLFVHFGLLDLDELGLVRRTSHVANASD